MARSERLGAEREEAVRRLKEVRVQITRSIVGRRSVAGGIDGLTRAWNFPGRRINQGNAHAPSSARGEREDKFEPRLRRSRANRVSKPARAFGSTPWV